MQSTPVRRTPIAMMTLLASGAVLAACHVEVPPPTPPTQPNYPAAELPPGTANGKAQRLQPGLPMAWWVWRSPDNRWHVRTTTRGPKHIFRGTIAGVSSPLAAVNPVQAEFGDKIVHRQDGSALFLFSTAGHIDGIDLWPQDGGCVRFHLWTDDRSQPNTIHVGANETKPPSDFFVACP